MKYIKYLITAMVLLAVSQTAQGAVLDSCDQWASYCSGGYCVYNAVWDPQGSWNQCITAQSTTQWSCTATHPSNGVKSYPNSSREPLGVSIGSITSLSSSVSAGSGPSSGDWNLAYDLWAPEEIMIWLQWNGNVGIWGSYVTTASIGGRTYDVYKNGYPGFMVQSQMTGGTFNVKAVLDYCVSQGWCSNSGILANVQCGYEITGASNITFSMNSFSVSIESTEPIEEPPSPPPPSETPTTGVWYKILAGHCSKALSTDGDNAVQMSDTGAQSQHWMLETVDSYYRLINRSSSKCLQVEGWSTEDGGNVNQGTVGDDFQNNQHWSLTKEGDYYQIINRNSSKLVDVEANSINNGGNIHQWSYFGADAFNQKWSFQTVGGSTTTTTAATTSTTTTAATTSTTTTAATTSTTTTAATTSTTSATTTTTSGGSCDCGTCDWYGTDVPTCCESCSGWGWYDGGCRRSCVCPGSCPGGDTTTTAATTSTTTTAATTSTTTTAATTSTTTTAATTSTTTTAATTSTTTTASSTSTTTTSGGSCDCGTCSWWGNPIPMCCIDVGGWGWQDGGCNRSCVSESICPNN